MKKIFYKIFGIYILIFIPLTVLILFLIFNTINSYYMDRLTSDLVKLNLTFHEQIRETVVDGDVVKLDRQVKKLGKKIDTRITIIDTDGEVLADSQNDPAKMENHASRSEITQAYSGQTGSSLRYSTTVRKNMLYVALPLNKNGEIIAVTRFSLFVDNIDELISQIRNNILLIIGIIGFVSLILLWLFSRNITGPIAELARASQKVADGDYDTKVFISNTDELRKLSESFNQMTDKVRESFLQKSMQQEELELILSSMEEGLVVFDSENKIVQFNKSFKKIVGTKDLKGRLYWEVVRDIRIQKLVDKVRTKKSFKNTEVQIDDRYYQCSANYINIKDEIVLLLFDISDLKNLEDMKKDLIVNVSHELKTPLTAIKGFVETMEEEGEGEASGKYLEIISRHTARLIAIVNDLLTISKLEDTKTKQLHLSEIDPKVFTDNVLKLFEERQKEKGIELSAEIEEGFTAFRADAFKLEQLLINLIDNAFNYTNEGGISIGMSMKKGNVLIKVTDTGPGIPKSDINRVFERFYTVDKSRSRKNGGTGLGLSIVKHIVQLHGGNIEIDSELGQGTTFIVSIPLDIVETQDEEQKEV